MDRDLSQVAELAREVLDVDAGASVHLGWVLASQEGNLVLAQCVVFSIQPA